MKPAPYAGQSPPAEAVAARRAEARMTQPEAARLVYATVRIWQMYEAGSVPMPADRWELFWMKTRARCAYTKRKEKG